MTLMFEACRVALDFLGSPGSQAQLMWRVRLGRLCHAGQSAFRGDLCLEERRLHEALEDEVSASWQRKKNEVLAALEREEEQRQLDRQQGMLLLSEVDSD